MSGKLKARIKQLVGSRGLFYLPPSLPSAPAIREIFASAEVRDGASPPWPKFRTGMRHAAFRATLDHFSEGNKISVAEDPFRKPSYAFLARVDPVEDEFWDIRCLRVDDGIRCFGGFGGRDLFIALTWEFRDEIGDQFDDEVKRCKAEWKKLFGPLTPQRGNNLDEYITNYVAC